MILVSFSMSLLSFWLMFYHLDPRFIDIGLRNSSYLDNLFQDIGLCRTTSFGTGGHKEHYLASCSLPMNIYFRFTLIIFYWVFAAGIFLHAFAFIVQVLILCWGCERRSVFLIVFYTILTSSKRKSDLKQNILISGGKLFSSVSIFGTQSRRL